eukprot:2909531-Pyramimonas_sp.AAC.1
MTCCRSNWFDRDATARSSLARVRIASPPWSLFSKVATRCLAASACASRSSRPPWKPRCGRARKASTVAQHRGPGNSLEAAVRSKQAHSGGGASSWATKRTVEKMHVRGLSHEVVPRPGPRTKPRYSAEVATRTPPQDGAALASRPRKVSRGSRWSGMIVVFPRWRCRPETRAYSSKICSKTRASPTPERETKARSSAYARKAAVGRRRRKRRRRRSAATAKSSGESGHP